MLSSLSHRGPSAQSVETGLYAGLDLGGHSAKLVLRAKDENASHVIRAACLRLSADAWNDVDSLLRQLRPWLRDQVEPNCRRIVANLRSSFVDYEAVELSGTAGVDPTSIADDSLRQLLGEDAAMAVYDYWPSGNRRLLHLTWTAADFASKLVNGLAYDGWECSALDVPAAALARIADRTDASDRGQLVVDVAGGEASLVWSHAGVAEYVRNRIRFAPESSAEALARSLNVRAEVAEILLQRWGLGETDAASAGSLERLIRRHLSDWLERLAFEIQRTLRFLEHQYGPPTAALVCGGAACLRGLPAWLTARFGLPFVTPALPHDWRWESAEPFSPLYAQAVALAHYGEAL